MAAAPAVAGFVGRAACARRSRSPRRWREIAIGEHPHFRIPTLDDRGAPVGIDVRRVVATGITPLINTGIAGRRPGVGQIGAGTVRAPLACFEQALAALAETLGTSRMSAPLDLLLRAVPAARRARGRPGLPRRAHRRDRDASRDARPRGRSPARAAWSRRGWSTPTSTSTRRCSTTGPRAARARWPRPCGSPRRPSEASPARTSWRGRAACSTWRCGRAPPPCAATPRWIPSWG